MRRGRLRTVRHVSDYLAPGWFAQHFLNPIAMRLNMAATLQVRTRSGATQEVPVNVLEHGGSNYLVSVRGESQWVRNIRRSGWCVLKRGSESRAFSVTEIPVPERSPLISAYRDKWDVQVRQFFKDLPDAADHPVFALRESAVRE